MADSQEIRKRVVGILNTGASSNPSFNIRQNRPALEAYLQELGLPYDEAAGFATEFIAYGLVSADLSRTAKRVADRLTKINQQQPAAQGDQNQGDQNAQQSDQGQDKPKKGWFKAKAGAVVGGTWGVLKSGGSKLKAGSAAAGRGIGSGAKGVGAFAQAAAQPSGPQTFLLFLLILAASFFFAIDMTAYAIIALLLILPWMLSEEFRTEFFTWKGGLFLFILFMHLMLFKSGFAYSWRTISFIWIMFLPWLFFILFFGEDRRRQLTHLFIILICSLAIYALPALATKFIVNETLLTSAVYVAAILPLPALYLLREIGENNSGGYADRILHWFLIWGIMVPLFIMAVVGVLKAQDVMPKFDLGKADTRGGFGGFVENIQEKTKEAWNKVTGDYKKYTDPGAYYTGRVEENKLKPNGVEIVRFRPQDKTVSNESPIILHGVVNAKSFIGTSVEVQPSCLIDRKNAPESSVDPQILEVIYGTGQTFTCSFPPMKSSTYTVKGSVTFPFETWSYITYTFVDKERAINLAKQQLDVNNELDIPEDAIATFTSGPIMVGMGGSTQPLLIDPNDQKNILQPGSTIGVTIEPAWEGGHLQRVDRFELKVPAPFLLDTARCDRNLTEGPTPDIYAEGYTNYVFENPNQGPVTTHTSVTCPILINDAAAASLLVTEADKTERSFIAVVRYWYTVEEKTTVQVK